MSYENEMKQAFRQLGPLGEREACEIAATADAEITALKQRVAELKRKLEAALKVTSCLHDFATAHQKWEAALIMDDAAWSGGMAALPTLTETLYAGMIELQRQRAAALVTYDLAAYRATQTKEPRDA